MYIERILTFVTLEHVPRGLLGNWPWLVIQDGDDRRCGTRKDVDPQRHHSGVGKQPLKDVFDFLHQPVLYS